MDDILVYSSSWAEHLSHLQQVLQKLRESQFFAKLNKCSFGQSSIHYLGYIISDTGVATDPDKTEAMESWPTPTSVTELRGFLGLTDACDTGVAVLMQQGHPIAYMSKALGILARKLSIYEKEFLAVIMAVDKWRQYLQRGPFTILTDHKSFSNLNDQLVSSDLQRKAMAKLVGLQFEIKYKKGSENGAADSLSRVGYLMSIQSSSGCTPDWLQEVLNSYTTDAHVTALMQELTVQSPNEKGYALHQGLITYKGRLFIGDNLALQTKLISSLHDIAIGGHSGIHASY